MLEMLEKPAVINNVDLANKNSATNSKIKF